MHTPTLPQISGAAPRANANANANASGDGAQFSQALSREIEQRKPSPSPAAAPVKPQAAAARPQQAAPAQQAERQPAAAPVESADGKRVAASGDAAATDDAKNDAADAAAVNPVADMLALVAAFNQPAAVAAAPVTDPLAAAAAVAALKKAPEPIEYSAQPVELAPTAASETLDGAALPAADGKTLSFKDVAAAVDGAARMVDASAPPEPLKVDLALPRSPVDAGATAAAEKAPASLSTLAAVAAPAGQGDGDTAPVMTKAEPALAPTMAKVDAAAPRAREGVADIAAIKEPAAVAAAPVSAPVQQASLVMANGVHANPGERIAARVGTPGWDNQVAQKIVWMVAGKEQSATLTLNPPDMGPMQVVLSVTNDQATVSFTAAQPEVRQALENAMPKLREMMSESGISLGNASVSEGAQDQRQAQQGDKSRGQGGGNRFGGGGDVAGPAEAPRTSRNAGTGLVDTFA
ncbi:MAG: flagellar hook-length control protein FliK [Telluria sp.]